ncbi:mitochondrial carrier protein [Strigomonas culicis]|nr:mitochondrial carrier protein [Strigomonas culicis]|eukprot:EPY19055.1 mitochondrial carrier protein [Strigomonas culicis]
MGAGGLRGSYRGLGAALTCNLVGEIAYLFTLEALKERMTKGAAARDGGDVAAEAFEGHSGYAAVAAMCGDVVSLLTVTPLVIVANRQMTAQYGLSAGNAYSGVRTTLTEVWRTFQPPRAAAGWAGARLMHGLRGLYQGTSAGLLRIPASGCWWALYTKSKEELYVLCAPRLEEYRQHHAAAAAAAAPFHQHEGAEHVSLLSSPVRLLLSGTDNPAINGLASAIASTATTLVFNPLAVIQTRQQTLPPAHVARLMGAPQRGGGRRRLWRLYASSFKKTVVVAQELVRVEGFRAFFKGATANVGVAVFDGIIFSLIFELTKLSSDLQYLS